MKPDCPICFGLGWVCENHSHLPWTDEDWGCQCGAGMPCECNQPDDAGIDEPDVSGVSMRPVGKALATAIFLRRL
jgi:hypothetical protein